jgi:peptide-methionine (S)-S-oxide reductase
MKYWLLGLAALPVAAVLWMAGARGERATVVPPPALDEQLRPDGGVQTAVLAGGCFWGVQAVFQHVKGVSRAVSGYSGGSADTASYRLVGTGRTGHAESVEIDFDPTIVSYGTILRIFFSVAHNPTELNRQGPDSGPQYRSAIFARTDGQRRVAEAYIAQLDGAHVFDRPIVTRVDSFTAFYQAEGYHQDYATLHPNEAYIASYDRPKVANLKRLFPDFARDTPVLVTGKAPRS